MFVNIISVKQHEILSFWSNMVFINKIALFSWTKTCCQYVNSGDVLDSHIMFYYVSDSNRLPRKQRRLKNWRRNSVSMVTVPCSPWSKPGNSHVSRRWQTSSTISRRSMQSPRNLRSHQIQKERRRARNDRTWQCWYCYGSSFGFSTKTLLLGLSKWSDQVNFRF